MHDREGAKYLIKGKASKLVKKIWADMAYRGKCLKDLMKVYGKDLEIVQRPRRWFWVTKEQIEKGDIPVVPSFKQYYQEDGWLRELLPGLVDIEE